MTNTDLVLGCYEAYARGDIEAAVAPLHPEVVWLEPEEFTDGGPHRGREAVRAYLERSRARWTELTVEPHADEVNGRIVIVVRHRGRLVSGAARDVTVADVFTVREGQIVHMQAFANPEEALRVTREAGPVG